MLSTAETAKEVRKALKSSFPGIKFSVRISIYANGSSISVTWTDGPTEQAIKEVTCEFEGAYLGECGGDTIKMYRDNEYGADYVTPRRKFSVDFLTSLATKYCERYHEDMPEVRWCYDSAYIQGDPINYYAPCNEINRLAAETDASKIDELFTEVEEVIPEQPQAKESEQPAIVEYAQPKPGQTVLLTAGSHRGETATYLYTQKTHPTAHVQLHTPEEDESGMYCCPLSILRVADEQPDPEQEKQERQEQAAQLALGIYEALLEQEQEQEKATPEAIETEESEQDTPEAEQVVDPRSNPDADVFYRFDKVSRMHWLEFPGKPDASTLGLLKKDGWRWSGYRKQWYNNRKWTIVPEGIEYFNAGYCDYAAERADRLEERAEKAATRGQQHYQRVRSIADHIPFGQPILVGHHSEKRARKDAERIDTGMRNYIQEATKAERLEGKADSSRTHQAYLESAGVISRRVQRLETDLRAYHRNRKGWGDDQEWQRRVTLLEQEIAENKAKLEALGGIKADHLNVEKGDIIKIDGFVGRVETHPRKGCKTYTYTITEGGAKGMRLTTDRSRLQAIVKKHNEVQAS